MHSNKTLSACSLSPCMLYGTDTFAPFKHHALPLTHTHLSLEKLFLGLGLAHVYNRSLHILLHNVPTWHSSKIKPFRPIPGCTKKMTRQMAATVAAQVYKQGHLVIGVPCPKQVQVTAFCEALPSAREEGHALRARSCGGGRLAEGGPALLAHRRGHLEPRARHGCR